MLGLRSIFSRLATYRPQTFYQPVQSFHLSEIDLRARKGTREKREKLKKKIKAEKLAKSIKKVGTVHRKRGSNAVDKHETDELKLMYTDDAFPMEYYQRIKYRLTDAIQYLKEYHDPTMWDALKQTLRLTIEMNMIGDKPTRLVSSFQKLVMISHPFSHGQERNILALAKNEEQQSKASLAGAALVGGPNLIKTALKGNVRFADYDFILAHPDIMPEMLALRGLLKKKFPTAKSETLGIDLEILVKRFLHGISIQAQKVEHKDDFGVINTLIGTLEMPTDHIIDNFNAIVTSANEKRPNRSGKFITRAFISTEILNDGLQIDPIDFPFKDYDRPPTEAELAKLAKQKAMPRKNAPAPVRTYSLFRTPI